MRDQLSDADKLLWRKVKFHVSGVLLKLVNHFLGWRSKYIVYSMNLIEFVFTWKNRKQRQNLEKDTSNAPNVHFVTIVSVRK